MLNEMISILKNNPSALIFTSDHGESIGENNRHGHASLFPIAPLKKQMFHSSVGFLIHFHNKQQK